MIQVDERVQGSRAGRRGDPREAVGQEPPAGARMGAPPDGDGTDDEDVIFVSPPPLPFPRVFPGL